MRQTQQAVGRRIGALSVSITLPAIFAPFDQEFLRVVAGDLMADDRSLQAGETLSKASARFLSEVGHLREVDDAFFVDPLHDLSAGATGKSDRFAGGGQ